MTRLHPWWAPPALALQFLTRVPVPRLSALSSEQVASGLARAMAWFPLVGGAVGLATAGVLVAADLLWPAILGSLLAMAVEARLTGAMHEDAVADYCDALGGGLTRERTLEIMRDSRIGTYGALGLGLGVGLRVLATAALLAADRALAVAGVVAAAAVGRWAATVLMVLVAPVPRPVGLAKDIGARARPVDAVVATAVTVPFVVPLALLAPVHLAAGSAATAVMILALRAQLLRRLGGSTGDCLGFAAYAGQLLLLLAAAARP